MMMMMNDQMKMVILECKMTLFCFIFCFSYLSPSRCSVFKTGVVDSRREAFLNNEKKIAVQWGNPYLESTIVLSDTSCNNQPQTH